MKRYFIIMVLLMFGSQFAIADGIGFQGDRVAEYTTSVIKLTKEQQMSLDTVLKNEKTSVIRSVSLSSEQKTILKEEAGFSPDELQVWPLIDAKDTCTCELLNIGIRFKPDRLEVPHFLLGEDHEDSRKTRADRLTEKKKFPAILWPAITVLLLTALLLLYIKKRKWTLTRTSTGNRPAADSSDV